MLKEALVLIACVIIAFLPGAAGFIFERGEWYTQLVKPEWTPPDAVFGPVWAVIYTLTGISLYLVKRDLYDASAGYYVAFGAQFILNFFWTAFFFGAHQLVLALADAALLFLAVLWMISSGYEHSRAASLLLLPYLLWVGFAVALNGHIVYLNALPKAELYSRGYLLEEPEPEHTLKEEEPAPGPPDEPLLPLDDPSTPQNLQNPSQDEEESEDLPNGGPPQPGPQNLH